MLILIKVFEMVRNEETSEQVATYASELLRMEKPLELSNELWKKIQSVAGSALTQAPDKPKVTISQYYAALAIKSHDAEKSRVLAPSFYKAFKNAQRKN